jgi:hypothetical protein
MVEDSQFTVLVEHTKIGDPLPSSTEKDSDGASSHTLATDSASLRRREGLVEAPEDLSTETLDQKGSDAYRGTFVKELNTGILDVSPRVSLPAC